VKLVSRHLVIASTVSNTIEHLVQPQLPALLDAGWRVSLVAAPGDWLEGPDVGAARFGIAMERTVSPVKDARAVVAWHRLMLRLKPDVVLGGTPKAGLLSMVASRAARVPRRIFLHRGTRWEATTGSNRRLLMKMEQLTMSSATEVLAVSPSLADLMVAQGLTSQRPIVLGAGGSKGVNLDVWKPHAGAVDTTRPPTIGYLGRLSIDKGLETVLATLDRMRARWPETKLRLAGGVDAADPADELVLNRIRTDPGIHWAGRTDDVPRFLSGIDVLVFPSAREGLPNAVIEAAACGVPCVGWRVTGVRDAVRSGVSGFLVDPGDTEMFFAAVGALLDEPRGARRDRCVTWARNFDQKRLTALTVEYLGNPAARSAADWSSPIVDPPASPPDADVPASSGPALLPNVQRRQPER
jgi:glycosyltransferase involved in cell wall biosynthesis